MAIGKTFQQYEERYQVRFNELTSSWTILDLWHPSLENMEISDELPDDSPALTHLTEDGLLAVLTEAKRLGRLKRYVPYSDISSASLDEDLEESYEGEQRPRRSSESFKRYIVQNLMKLAISEDIAESDR